MPRFIASMANIYCSRLWMNLFAADFHTFFFKLINTNNDDTDNEKCYHTKKFSIMNKSDFIAITNSIRFKKFKFGNILYD